MSKRNNKGFLLAESLIVSTFVLTVLIFLFIQFRSIMISNKRTYIYNSIEDIYTLGSISDYYKNNLNELDAIKNQLQPEGQPANPYIYIYKKAEANSLCSGACNEMATAGKFEYIIYTNSNISNIKTALNDENIQDLKTFIKKIDAQTVEGMGRLIGKLENGHFVTVVLNTTIKNRKPIIKSWGGDDQTDFHATAYRDKITKVFFENQIVTTNAIATWDVSANPNEPVIAWVTADPADSSKYYLHIGGKGGVMANTNSSNLFRYFAVLNEIRFGKLDANGNIEENYFDTSNAVDISYMFAGGNALEKIDVSKFDTSNVTNMAGLFTAYDNRKPGWADDTKRKLKSIPGIGNFNTTNVKTMADMFSGQQFTSINLSKYDTSNVTSFFHMFNGCSKVQLINLSNWDTSKVANMNSMFANCSALKKIYVTGDKFKTTAVTNDTNMFNGCTAIVGGNGKVYNSSHVNKTYAIVDGKDTGYFTASEDYDIPISSLLLWGEAKNPSNTTSVLRNKMTGATTATLTGFNNTTASGFNGSGINRDLVFDGSNDYIYTGMEKKNFGDHISFLIYADVSTTPSATYHLIGDWEASGSGMWKSTSNQYGYQVHQSTEPKGFKSVYAADDATKYDFIAGVYDGTNVKIYLNGELKATTAFVKPMTVSTVRLVIGANPGSGTSVSGFAKMRLKEVLIYQKALTDADIARINNYMKTKYNQ
ncbi:MAG: BspA family leucine-rich repeat surface protein [Bacilli bacterium]|nr:BspA family leucine-rich repeat surface protein [Bacilli bacterium]